MGSRPIRTAMCMFFESFAFFLVFTTNGNEFAPFPLCEISREVSELLSETESLNYRTVSLDILLCKVIKKLLSVSNHLGKTSLRMEILRILLHVHGKAVDSIGKDSDLYLGRAGVVLVDLVLSDDGGLGFL